MGGRYRLHRRRHHRTLHFVIDQGGPRSRLVFTFGDAAFSAETAAARIARAGFGSFTEFDGNALWRRYLPGDPHPNAWVMQLGTAIV